VVEGSAKSDLLIREFEEEIEGSECSDLLIREFEEMIEGSESGLCLDDFSFGSMDCDFRLGPFEIQLFLEEIWLGEGLGEEFSTGLLLRI